MMTEGTALRLVEAMERMTEVMRTLNAPSPAAAGAPESDLLDIVEAAAVLTVSETTVERLVRRKKLVRVEVSPRCFRFRRADLQRYLGEKSSGLKTGGRRL